MIITAHCSRFALRIKSLRIYKYPNEIGDYCFSEQQQFRPFRRVCFQQVHCLGYQLPSNVLTFSLYTRIQYTHIIQFRIGSQVFRFGIRRSTNLKLTPTRRVIPPYKYTCTKTTQNISIAQYLQNNGLNFFPFMVHKRSNHRFCTKHVIINM